VMPLPPPVRGTLLRDGFALTGGDVFTQEDVDHGRVRYRHDGGPDGEDSFTFATPEGEVQPAVFPIRLLPRRGAPELTGAGRLNAVLEGCRVADVLGDTVRCRDQRMRPGLAVVGVSGRGEWQFSADGEVWLPVGEARRGSALLL